MRKAILAAVLGLACATAAAAHFVFVLPDAGGKGAKVVFSDELAPDEAVDVGKIAATELVVRDAMGKGRPVKMVKGDHAYTVKLDGAAAVEGTTEYGVVAKGKGKPFLLRYHSRAVLDPVAKLATTGKPPALEVVPSFHAGSLRFQVLAAGKPLARAQVTVIVPGAKEKRKVTTGETGLTEAFTEAGRFGVVAGHVEERAGTHDGKKYEEVRTYATLVVDVKPAGRK
jgi:uncharacterized GH25 family protein